MLLVLKIPDFMAKLADPCHIASDKVLFLIKSTDIFSYFSTEIYVVGTH